MSRPLICCRQLGRRAEVGAHYHLAANYRICAEMSMRQVRRWIRVTTMAAATMAMAAATTACAQHYPILPVPGAPHGIFTLMQDSHSAIWMGTIDDVFRFDGEHFYSLRPYGFPKETPNSFAEDSDGGIWIATQGTDANGGTVA